MLTAGGWLIWYLHRNPVPLETQAQTENPSRTKDPEVTTTVLPSADENSKPAGSESTSEDPKEKVSKELLALMATGQEFEQREDYASALAAFRRAYDMDPQYEEAGIAVKRVTLQINEVTYRQALSAGLKALEKKEYGQARKHLIKASSIKPGGREAKDALASLNQTLRRNRISRLKQKGQAAEAAENWEAARRQYDSILAIDTGNAIARQGLIRAQNQIRVMADIQAYVGKPEKLIVNANLEKARSLLDEARSLEPRGPQLNRSIGLLEEMVAKAQRPVQVIITSDNQTQVDVYRIGRLGQFIEKRLDLKPGVYTVVGHREGYQDVRYEIVIQPGQESQQLTVICKVKV